MGIIASEPAVFRERCTVFNLSFCLPCDRFFIFILAFLYFMYDFIINGGRSLIVHPVSLVFIGYFLFGTAAIRSTVDCFIKGKLRYSTVERFFVGL